MSDDVLMPCPFCGSKATYYCAEDEYGYIQFIQCDECLAEMNMSCGYEENQEKAKEILFQDWNRRA